MLKYFKNPHVNLHFPLKNFKGKGLITSITSCEEELTV